MKRGTQKRIAEKANISKGFLSELIATKKRPSWHTAKKLGSITKIDPVLWLEGSSEDIKTALFDTTGKGVNQG